MEGLPVSIRLNPFKRPVAEPAFLAGASPVPWSPWGRTLRERPVFTRDPLFHAGCYYVQDASAMFVGDLFRRLLPRLSARPLRVLDLCAAPGGKTTDLSASLRLACGDDFLLVSNEVMRQRARVLCDNTALWGDPRVMVTSVDPAVIGRCLPGFFDCIVADVPCSGEGMFRKDERARTEWSPAVVDFCAARQKRILSDVWPALKQGGILVYSTCTYEAAENDDNLRWAAATLGGEIIPPADVYACSGVRRTECGHLLRAGEVSGEGQWAGALAKEASAPSLRRYDPLSLRPLRNGVAPAVRKGRDLVPSPDRILSIEYDHSLPEAELDLETALRFLHRDAIVLEGAPVGYVVVTFRAVPLGLVKNLGRRCNNLHPASRRIRMDI